LAGDWWALRPHLWRILLVAVVTTTLAAVYVLRIPKLYEAVAAVRIDTSAPTSPVAGAGLDTGSPDVNILMATEQAEVASPAIMAPVASRLKLAQMPEFAGSPAGVTNVSTTVPLPVIATMRSRLTVLRVPNTFLLEIHFRAQSPNLAADIANELANELIRHEFATRSDSLLNTSHYMSGQINELRAKMERSQSRLADFERETGFIDPSDKFNLLNQRLSTLATQLDQDRALLRQAASDMSLARNATVDSLAVSGRGEALKPFLEAEHVQRTKLDAIASKYGPRNSVYLQSARELKESQAALMREKDHIVAQLTAAMDAATVRERLTAAAFAHETTAQQAISAKAVDFTILQRGADADQKVYDDLLARVKAADISAGYHAETLRIVGWAEPQPSPVYPKPALVGIIVLLTSFGLGILVVLAFHRLDRTITTPEQIDTMLHATCLASLPKADAVSELHHLVTGGPALHRSLFTESILSLRTALLLGQNTASGTIAVTSATANEGKSVIATNLAAALALQGFRVVLVDADLRRPGLHRDFAADNRLGLAAVLHERCQIGQATQPTQIDNLWVLPAGPADIHSADVAARRFGQISEELKSTYDFVVIDLPPVMFADALAIAATADTVVLVVHAAQTPRDLVRAALHQLHTARAHVAGLVLNQVSNTAMTHYYYEAYRAYHPPKRTDAIHD